MTYMDGILAKFDPNGGHIFSKRIGGPASDYIMSLALDSNGDVLIGGQLGGTVDLGGGAMDPGSPTIDWAYVAVGFFTGTGNLGLGSRTADGDDGYVIGYSLAGQPRWVRQYGSSGNDIAFSVAAASDGIFLGGTFTGTLFFDGRSFTSAGFNDGFVLKLPLQP